MTYILQNQEAFVHLIDTDREAAAAVAVVAAAAVVAPAAVAAAP